MQDRIEPVQVFSGSETVSALAWDGNRNQLWISDYSGQIFQLHEDSTAELWRDLDFKFNSPLGITFWHDSLIAFQPAIGMVLNLDARPGTEVISREWRGQRLNGPLAGAEYGRDLYVIDPIWDPIDLGFSGLFRLTTKHLLILADDALQHPATLAISKDKLIVLNFRDEKIQWIEYQLPVLGEPQKKILFELPAARLTGHIPCGMDIDDEGNIYTALPDGVVIVSPSGQHINTLHISGQPSACVLSSDNSHLFVASDKQVWSIELSAAAN